MTTSTGATPDPHHEPATTEADALPSEEGIDPAKVDEQLATEPDEAENYTDNYAPDPGEDT
jgi:hypothetical protein